MLRMVSLATLDDRDQADDNGLAGDIVEQINTRAVQVVERVQQKLTGQSASTRRQLSPMLNLICRTRLQAECCAHSGRAS